MLSWKVVARQFCPLPGKSGLGQALEPGARDGARGGGELGGYGERLSPDKTDSPARPLKPESPYRDCSQLQKVTQPKITPPSLGLPAA